MARPIKTPEMAKKKEQAFSRIQVGEDPGIREFLREKRGLIQKLESEREAEYAAAKQSFSKIIL